MAAAFCAGHAAPVNDETRESVGNWLWAAALVGWGVAIGLILPAYAPAAVAMLVVLVVLAGADIGEAVLRRRRLGSPDEKPRREGSSDILDRVTGARSSNGPEVLGPNARLETSGTDE